MSICKFSLYFIFFLILSVEVKSQVIYENKNDSVKVFSLAEETFQPDSSPTLKSVVHFGWLQPLRGQYPFFYEKGLGAHFGASLGIGFTYADLFRKAHSNLLFDNSIGKMQLGLHAEALLKYYFSGLAIEDYYLGVNVKFSSYNYENYEAGYTKNIQERRYQYLLIVGTQFNEIGNRLVYDYYAGFGLTSLFMDDEVPTNSNGSFVPVPITSFIDNHAIIRIGVKMGLKIN